MNIELLSWHLPEHEQRANMAALKIDSDEVLQALLLPVGMKDCWQNCAVVLASLDNSRLLPFLPELLEWYKDMNWPGFDIINRRISLYPNFVLQEAVDDALRRAADEHDVEWYENLQTAFEYIAIR